MDCPLKRETYYIFLQCGEWKNWGKETKMISFLCTRIRRYVCEICGFFFFFSFVRAFIKDLLSDRPVLVAQEIQSTTRPLP